MFYGGVTNDGNVDTGMANSNNWTVSYQSRGFYKISLNEYIHYRPLVTVVPHQNAQQALSPRIAYASSVQANSQWSIYVNTAYQTTPGTAPSTGSSGSPAHTHTYSYNYFTAVNLSFCFSVRSGMTRVFNVDPANTTITLIPSVVTFNNRKVLVLSTDYSKLQIGSSSFYLDKGTELLGVGSELDLKLSTSSVSDGTYTWNLTGWTYGGGYGANGKQWDSTPGSGSSNRLTVNPSQSQQLTTPYTFAITGVATGATLPPAEDQYISTDPVVRLSNVSPGGLILS